MDFVQELNSHRWNDFRCDDAFTFVCSRSCSQDIIIDDQDDEESENVIGALASLSVGSFFGLIFIFLITFFLWEGLLLKTKKRELHQIILKEKANQPNVFNPENI